MEKVLVVDSAQAFSMMLCTCISELHDIECLMIDSFKEAQSVLSVQAGEFFCAIVDTHLIDASHGEAVELVLSYGITTIVLTDCVDDVLREEFLQMKVADYVLKSGQYNRDYVVGLVQRLYANTKIKVLVVDDSVFSRKQTSKLLAIQRFQVLEADSGEEALTILDKHPDIRMALLDCYMDGISGFELTTKIREKYTKEELVIIGVSGQGGQAVSVKFLKSGANDFIAKPFLPEELNCRVNQNADFIDQFYQLKIANERKNQFLGMAAHDISGPLGVVQGIAQVLLKKERSPEQQQQFFQIILKTSTEMLEILNNLLDISAIESGKVNLVREQVDFSKLIHERIDFSRYLLEKKEIEVIENVPQYPEILLDPARIKQVIDNLLSNAIKYSPFSSQVEVSLIEKKKYLRLEVKDHGSGVRAGDVERLFDAFQNIDSVTTGGEPSHGLGLAICKSMVEAHFGKIGYKRNGDRGSCFYIDLPKIR